MYEHWNMSVTYSLCSNDMYTYAVPTTPPGPTMSYDTVPPSPSQMELSGKRPTSKALVAGTSGTLQ
eukprot:359931-Chlamydomonas_euryale.AAC.3